MGRGGWDCSPDRGFGLAEVREHRICRFVRTIIFGLVLFTSRAVGGSSAGSGGVAFLLAGPCRCHCEEEEGILGGYKPLVRCCTKLYVG